MLSSTRATTNTYWTDVGDRYHGSGASSLHSSSRTNATISDSILWPLYWRKSPSLMLHSHTYQQKLRGTVMYKNNNISTTRHFMILFPGTPGWASALTKDILTGTTTEFLWAGCPSCHSTCNVKALQENPVSKNWGKQLCTKITTFIYLQSPYNLFPSTSTEICMPVHINVCNKLPDCTQFQTQLTDFCISMETTILSLLVHPSE